MNQHPRNSSHRLERLRRRRARRFRGRIYVMVGLSVLALSLALAVVWLRPSPSEAPTTAEATATPADAAAATATPPAGTATTAPAAQAPAAVASAVSAPTATLPDLDGVFFDPQRFTYAPDFYEPEIQAFLDEQPGPLGGTHFQIGDRSQRFAEVLVNFSSLYSFDPRLLLALFEQQSQLISTAQPTPDQLALALGYESEDERHNGLYRQFYHATVTLRRAVRDYANTHAAGGTLPPLRFADESEQPVSANISLPRYVLSRVLAPTTTPAELPGKLRAFQATYTRLFGDPRTPPTGWPQPAEPFLTRPMERPFRVTSFFDHDTPFLARNGSLLSFWGTAEAALSYDGHTGWDYALFPSDAVLAAAPGRVVFVGNSDDGCATPGRGVVIDHGNGYRTLYWHLSTLEVEAGQQVERGVHLGYAGSTGCSFGPHLHFQVQYLGRDVDPYGWCGTTPDPWASNPAGQESRWLWADMPNPCGEPPPGTVVVDNDGPGFVARGEWQTSPLGYGSGALFTATSYTNPQGAAWQVAPLTDTPAVAAWQPTLPQAGHYRVLAYIPYVLNGMDDSQEVRYRVRHSEGQREILVDSESTANAWADLGTYYFDPATRPRVSLSTLAGDAGRGLWADAVVWVPVEDVAGGTLE